MLYKGVLAENYVSEILNSKYKELYYWQLGSEYEVEFLLNVDGDIIPVEVKSLDNTTSKSLNYYIERYKPKYAYEYQLRILNLIIILSQFLCMLVIWYNLEKDLYYKKLEDVNFLK